MSDINDIVDGVAEGIAADRADLGALRERVLGIAQHGSHAEVIKLALDLLGELEQLFGRWADMQGQLAALLIKAEADAGDDPRAGADG